VRAAKIFVAILGASNYTLAQARFSEALPWSENLYEGSRMITQRNRSFDGGVRIGSSLKTKTQAPGHTRCLGRIAS
jgi:hypothetical protein